MSTETKRAQELESLQLQAGFILNSLYNPVIVFDKGNRVVMCNRAFEDTVEIDRNYILGADPEKLYGLLKFKINAAPGGNTRRKHYPGALEASITTPKGKKRQLVLQCTPIHDPDGETIGVIVVASDVTQIKKEQQRLQQSEKIALLREMATGVAHEIKNPLTAIKGFSNIIAVKSRDSAIKDYAHIIESTADNANRVVNDFLTFAKAKPPALKETSLNELVYSLRLMLEIYLAKNGIECSFCLSDREKTIMADREQVKQVVLNIVENAVEAVSESANPRLKISTGLSDAGDEMFITISDNGRGMTRKDSLKVGTPFFTTKDQRTGLGLSICYKIVNEHGGGINVESEPGRGTSFTASFPCRVEKKQCASVLSPDTTHTFFSGIAL